MMRSTRRSLLRASLLLAATPILAACGGAAATTATTAPKPAGAAPTTAPAAKPAAPTKPAATAPAPTPVPTTKPAAGEKAKITFLGNHALAPGKAVEEAVKTFGQANPSIEVQWVNVPEGYAQKLQTLVAGGQPPDMFRLGGPEFASYVYRGFMRPLDEYMKRDNFDREDFYPVAFSQYQWDGKQFGLSSDVGNRMIFYNVNLWQEAKLAAPRADMAAEGWTFDDFAKAAAALTKRSGERITQFGFVNILDWMTWPLANGGFLWNEETTESMLHRPEALEVFQFLQDLMFKHKVAQTKEMAAELAPAQAFLTGKSGMTISSTATGTTTYRQIKAFDWDVIAIPRGPKLQGERRVFGGGSGWFIYRTTKYADQTWQLFRHMTSKASAELLAKQGFAPARLSVVNSPVWLDPSLPPKAKKVVTDGPKHIVPFPKSTTWGEWVNAVNKELDGLWSNKLSAAELGPKLKAATDPLVQKHLDNLKNAPKY